MKTVELGDVQYIGADIVPEMIERNKLDYPTIDFRCLDLTSDELPEVDLVFCRDCLVHFSLEDCHKALTNIKRSAKYVMMTTFPEHRGNKDKETGKSWTTRNLADPPFNFPKPLQVINEKNKRPKYTDKSLAVWSTEFIPDMVSKNRRKRLIKLWTEDPHCYYCKRKTVIVLMAPEERMPRRFSNYPLRATLEHLRSRLNPSRQEPISNGNEQRIVLACNECNQAQNTKEMDGLTREELWERSKKGHDNPRNKNGE